MNIMFFYSQILTIDNYIIPNFKFYLHYINLSKRFELEGRCWSNFLNLFKLFLDINFFRF
jgi:hypothetical protein